HRAPLSGLETSNQRLTGKCCKTRLRHSHWRPRIAVTHGSSGTAGTVTGHRDRYTQAGVNTEEADAGIRKLANRITETWPAPHAPGAVKLDIGYFANVVDIGGQGIAISTDGVGSKAMIATALGKYDTIGIDCVAMNVNDVICVGARPVSM